MKISSLNILLFALVIALSPGVAQRYTTTTSERQLQGGGKDAYYVDTTKGLKEQRQGRTRGISQDYNPKETSLNDDNSREGRKSRRCLMGSNPRKKKGGRKKGGRKKGALLLTPEQIACNFLSIPSLTECRATTEFDFYTGGAVTNGSIIPSEIGLLTQLTHLEFGWNVLTGSIPSSIASLTNLVHFGCTFPSTGSFTSFFSSLSKLTYLTITSTMLSGNIPSSLSSLTLLAHLDLSFNLKITGSIPSSLSSLSQLTSLDFHSGQLAGSIPPSLSSLTQLKYLTLGYNRLTGPIPSSLSSLTELSRVSLENNALTGTIPASLSSLTQLEGIDVSFNNLEGTVPPSFSNLTNLKSLYLNHND